jgi:exonuclease SbcC
MIPVKLTIEGLFGYRKRQEIDFAPLAEARLFGVFGPIGSGKSSIPEAILLALYGGLERLNQRESRGYNLMNLRSSRLFVEFTFVAGTPPATYVTTLETRRNSRRFEDVKTLERKAGRIENGLRVPVEMDEIVKALGLSYENFRRTIIIPQGRFQEFIQLEGVEKTKMLKEIFCLERFDLSAKTGVLIRQGQSSLENLAGRLSALEDTSEEALDIMIKEKTGAEKEVAVLVTRLKVLQEKESEQARFRDRHASWKILQEKQRKLEDLAPGMENAKNQIARFDFAWRNFRDSIRQQDELMRETTTLAEDCQRLTALIPQKEILLQQNREMQSKAEAEARNRPAREQKLMVIPEILRYREAEAGITECEDRLKKADAFLAEKNKETEQWETEIEKLQKRYHEKETHLPDPGILGKLREWYGKTGFLNEKVASLERQIEENKTNQQTLRESFNRDAGIQPRMESADTPDGAGIRAELDLQIRQIRQELKQIEAALETLNHKSVLADFSGKLADGVPCPLCGATQHPEVYSDPDARDEKNRLVTLRNALQNNEQQLQNALRENAAQMARLETYQKQGQSLIEELEGLNRDKAGHLECFDFEGFSPENRTTFETAVKVSAQLSAEMKSIREAHDKALEKLRQARADLERARKRQAELQSQMTALQTITRQCQERVTDALWHELTGFTNQALESEKDKLSELIRQSEAALENHREACGQLTNEIVALRTRLSTQTERLVSVSRSLEEIQNRLRETLDGSPFDSHAEVIEVLKDESATESRRAEVQNWEQERYATLKSIESLAIDPGVIAFDENAFMELQNEMAETNEKREALGRLIAQLTQKAGSLQQQLDLKSKLLAQKEALENRLTRLNDLKRLFQANGFVNFISTVYLKNLIQMANHRFQGFTGHRLQLELNDRNEFVVRDLMNNGETRHIKTLSGGQTFLASLSMAIALADIIQGHKPGSGNFFFIDEGFGSLDKPSLQTVFQALQSLSREKRIVGIISHVEELQDEIQTFLRVSLDMEEGSRIVPSWL